MNSAGMEAVKKTLEENKKAREYKFYTRLYRETWEKEILYIRLIPSSKAELFNKLWGNVEELIREGIKSNGAIPGKDFITVIEEQEEFYNG
jgi:hypothetical protein